MNNRGFTLIELLGVLIILAVIISIVFPTVNSVVNKGKTTVDNIQTNKILKGAYDYSLKKPSLLPDSGQTTYIMFNELKKYGYVDSDIINPNTNQVYPKDIVISIKNVGNKYNKKTNDSMLQGNYLYKLNIKNNKCDPSVTINGETNLITVNIGDSFEEPTYSAIDCDGADITDKVVKNIVKDGKNINNVDSYKNGIYDIDYCVLDDYGNSVCKTVSIVIKDSELPSLTIPENVTLSTSTTKYDLMNGVVCNDNSKKCEVDIEGSIKFGTTGKYIIKYIASDPSGNTIIKKRVITIN